MTTITPPKQVARIRDLNNMFRRTFIGGKVLMTAGVAALPEKTKAQVLSRVREYNDFTDSNDPHGEADLGSFEIDGETYMFKLDYYDLSMEFGSQDPADPSMTTRVLTILRADEY